MPDELVLEIIFPIHKKNDKSVFDNYRGITLLIVMYKVLTMIMGKILRPLVETIVEKYEAGFTQGNSTTNHILTLQQILEQCYEYNVYLYQVFIYFKQAYDTVNISQLYLIMQEFRISGKLIRLIRIMIEGTRSVVKNDGVLSDEFRIIPNLVRGKRPKKQSHIIKEEQFFIDFINISHMLMTWLQYQRAQETWKKAT